MAPRVLPGCPRPSAEIRMPTEPGASAHGHSSPLFSLELGFIPSLSAASHKRTPVCWRHRSALLFEHGVGEERFQLRRPFRPVAPGNPMNLLNGCNLAANPPLFGKG